MTMTQKNGIFGLTITAWQNTCAFSAYAASEATEVCIVPKENLIKELSEKPGLSLKFYQSASKVHHFHN